MTVTGVLRCPMGDDLCPLPVLKARRQIGQMAAGEVLEVKADDPAAQLDFDHFCHFLVS